MTTELEMGGSAESFRVRKEGSQGCANFLSPERRIYEVLFLPMSRASVLSVVYFAENFTSDDTRALLLELSRAWMIYTRTQKASSRNLLFS